MFALITIFALIPLGVSNENCSDGWYVTGYFTPVENDYTGIEETIIIEDEARTFKKAFLDTVKIEAWGKTKQGDYLGWWDDTWHLNDKALDSQGNELNETSVAIDPSVIEHGTRLTLPDLPEPYDSRIFLTTDTGPDIKGKHIDVFTGEGKEAERQMYKITGYSRVCLELKGSNESEKPSGREEQLEPQELQDPQTPKGEQGSSQPRITKVFPGSIVIFITLVILLILVIVGIKFSKKL